MIKPVDQPSGLKMKYFVLRPGKGDIHGKASRAAMRTYARHIAKDDPDFARELREWADAEMDKHVAPGQWSDEK